MRAGFWWGNRQERRHFEDLGIEEIQNASKTNRVGPDLCGVG